MSAVPTIVPSKTKQYNIKQSKLDVVPKLPFKSIICAPSNSGKTVLITNLIEHVYKDCFERVYIISPSISVDDSWRSTKKYLDNSITVGENEPSLYQETFNEATVNSIMDTQKKLTDHIKKNKDSNRLYSILIVLDDVADDTSQRNSKALKSLFVNGRHRHINIILSSQKGSLLNPVARVHADSIYVFKLRNYQDLEMLLIEFSALVNDKKEMLEIYRKATEKPYSFLYINLKGQPRFYINFQQEIILE